jgi:uncharacterized membrane protein YqjE
MSGERQGDMGRLVKVLFFATLSLPFVFLGIVTLAMVLR